MRIDGSVAVVTGGASGLGLATVNKLVTAGAKVMVIDLPSEQSAATVADAGAVFASGDVTVAEQVAAAVDAAAHLGPLRILVHCAGHGGVVRVVEKDGSPGSLETFQKVIQTNLIGTFNVLRFAAAQMATLEPADEERGVCVLTSSIAAFEGQIGQLPYAASKAGIVGMTLVAARDLSARLIRVATIAPGIFDTPLLGARPESVRSALAAAVPHPRRLGRPEDFARLAIEIVENPMINGETIRLDGALRMAPR
jgi:NAD(P)-dependent dehydrogenase (short-subunit alcohol dehydrogenase family)